MVKATNCLSPNIYSERPNTAAVDSLFLITKSLCINNTINLRLFISKCITNANTGN